MRKEEIFEVILLDTVKTHVRTLKRMFPHDTTENPWRAKFQHDTKMPLMEPRYNEFKDSTYPSMYDTHPNLTLI